jgi:hypothetical protein
MNSTENGREYHGVDLSFTARLTNGTNLQGGIATGKVHNYACEVDDPNRELAWGYGTNDQTKRASEYHS